MHNRHLGYITTDPKDLGTALKLTVRIRLDKLGNDGRLAAVLKLYGLNHSFKRVTETPKSSDEEEEDKERTNNTLEISSKVTLGKSEVIEVTFGDKILFNLIFYLFCCNL